MKPWPNLKEETLNGSIDMLQYISRERDKDIRDWNNLSNIFISGRKVAKIPVGSGDVSTNDKLGDINWDADYLYILVNDGGSAAWRRAALGAW